MPLRTLIGVTIALPPPPPTPVPPVALIYAPRGQADWCWAAAAEMVLRLRGLFAGRQCEFAEYLFAPHRCCVTPASPNCDTTCGVGDVLKVFRHWKHTAAVYRARRIRYRSKPGADSLEDELRAARPVEVGWRYTGTTGGHLLVVHGWVPSGTVEDVLISDPNPKVGQTNLAYADLVTARGAGSWDHTWIRL